MTISILCHRIDIFNKITQIKITQVIRIDQSVHVFLRIKQLNLST